MEIRAYRPSDGETLAELFCNTVHAVNAKDYTRDQLTAWTASTADREKWNDSFKEHYALVAVDEGTIVGFGDIDRTGYLDRLYVHADYQRKGIATALCDQLEQTVRGKIVTHASITAKPFFEKRSYETIREQRVERQGVFLTNFVMVKNKTV